MKLIHAILFLATLPLAAQPSDEIRKSIYFDGGSYFIDSTQIQMFNDWLDSIPQLSEKFEIQLISHTDPIGGKRYNEWLSNMRSESVYELLMIRKIPDKIIHRKDWAFDNPVFSNQTRSGMRLNRRVDIVLHPIVF
jgi:outer membrane protein OmpA-like peptidoglycan-associated protein